MLSVCLILENRGAFLRAVYSPAPYDGLTNRQENMFSRLVKEYAYRQSVAERIKATKPPDWI